MLQDEAADAGESAPFTGEAEIFIPSQASRGTLAERAEARKASQDLLQHSGITRIICVDDCYAAAARTADEVSAALKANQLTAQDLTEIASTAGALATLAEPGLPLALAVTVLEDAWDSLDESHQARILAVVEARLGPELADGESYPDPDAAFTLHELLAEPHEYLTLTLHQWRARKVELLADTRRTLVLFDRDFSREGLATDAGEGEIESLLNEAPGDWKIGLLTHTVVDADAEVTTWRSLSKRFKAVSSRFLVIAKGRLAERPGTFPRMLKLTLLAPELEQLQQRVHEAVQEIWREANQNVLEIDPYTLEAALTGERLKEGTWGPETLLRVTGAFTQDRIRAKLRGDTEVHRATAQIALLGQIMPAISDSMRVRRELAEIERLEFYDSPEHLNELYFPIEAGDIFVLEDFDQEPTKFEDPRAPHSTSTEIIPGRIARKEGLKYLILLAQPCDLAVRSNGSRSNGLAYARMAPLHLISNRVATQPGGTAVGSFDLPYFDADTHAGMEARLSRQQIVPFEALDMCAFNADGRSALGASADTPALLLPNWRDHHQLLGKWVTKTAKQYAAMNPHRIPGKGAIAVTQALTNSGTCPSLSSLISVRGPAIHYGIRRVTRLREPYRSALLTRMAQREARDAFDPSLLDKGVE